MDLVGFSLQGHVILWWHLNGQEEASGSDNLSVERKSGPHKSNSRLLKLTVKIWDAITFN